jgi:hypothetical protein
LRDIGCGASQTPRPRFGGNAPLGGVDNIFGIRVVVSTQVPQGHAAVLDSKIALNIFRRWGLEIMANPYADSAFEYNQIH